jgi:hypothetical protein
MELGYKLAARTPTADGVGVKTAHNVSWKNAAVRHDTPLRRVSSLLYLYIHASIA